MYAIVTDGTKQLKVEEGQVINIDYRDVPAGEKITFDRILLVGGEGEPRIGQPLLSGASVTAEVLGPTQGPKLVVQKFRRRKTHAAARATANSIRRSKLAALRANELLNDSRVEDIFASSTGGDRVVAERKAARLKPPAA